MDECATPLVASPPVDNEVSVHGPTSDSEFVEVLRLELPRVQRIARLLTRSADAADDVVAEAISAPLPKWRTGGIDDCPAYLRRVVVNLSTRRWNRRALAMRRDHLVLGWLETPPDLETIAVSVTGRFAP